MGRPHIEVFQIDAAAAAEGREVVEPEGETGRRALPFGDVAEHPGFGAEQGRADVLGGGDHLVGQAFIVRELADEGEDQGRIVGLSRSDRQHGQGLALQGGGRQLSPCHAANVRRALTRVESAPS